MLSNEDALLRQHSITCKLCNTKFDSFGAMQRHVLTEHMQKGDYQIPLHKRRKIAGILIRATCNIIRQHF